MIFKKKKPTTPSIRNLIQLQNKTLAKKPIYKNLLKKKKNLLAKIIQVKLLCIIEGVELKDNIGK